MRCTYRYKYSAFFFPETLSLCSLFQHASHHGDYASLELVMVLLPLPLVHSAFQKRGMQQMFMG